MRTNVLLGILLHLLTAVSLTAALPDLVRLKMAAEQGDAVAQYEYGRKINDQREKQAWYMSSAKQGYAPAQDALAGIYAGQYVTDAKKKRATDREAVRWASRAAYQGNASAQSKLSSYYRSGKGVTTNPVAAYMWAQIAVLTKDGDRGTLLSMVERANRDGLIKTIQTGEILEGQRRAAAYTPMRFNGLNPVEADLVFGELQLSALYVIKDHCSAVVNNVRFYSGETKSLKLDDQTCSLTCHDVQSKSATIGITGTDYRVTLQIKR